MFSASACVNVTPTPRDIRIARGTRRSSDRGEPRLGLAQAEHRDQSDRRSLLERAHANRRAVDHALDADFVVSAAPASANAAPSRAARRCAAAAGTRPTSAEEIPRRPAR